MALSLNKPLQMAQHVWRRAAYKSCRLAPSLLSCPSQTSIATPAFTPFFNKPFSSTSATMASSKTFLDAIKDRRTIYQLNKEAPKSDKEIVEIINQIVLHVPSSFNSQSTRVVVLLNAEHEKFWEVTKEVLKPQVPEDQYKSGTEPKLNGFKAAYGTVLFFEDPEPVENLRKAFPLYAHHFGDWSEHTSAMHQYAAWVALEAEGFGANLQHYNPIVDQRAQEEWKIPQDWKLRAQLVFGGRAGEAGEKQFKPLEERVFVHGAKN